MIPARNACIMVDETSIKRQLQRDEHFQPPYCPNPACALHHPSAARGTLFWRRHATKSLKRFPYKQVRFRCLRCQRTFCASFFKFYYRQRTWGLNEEIHALYHGGFTKRRIARRLKVSEHLVRIRLRKMKEWKLLVHAQLTNTLPIHEPIVYDGIENFAFSQYDPNNTNHAVGKESLFIYDFNFAPLNRKGRMSPRQRRRKLRLEEQFGAYPRNAIRTSTKRLFRRLLTKTPALTVYSDRHFQYRRVVEEDINARIRHVTVSSKIARNFRNPLFAVNNIDLQLRQDSSAFKRETISFPKHSLAHMEAFILHALYRNYMRPKFWGTHRSDPGCSKRSPAMELGITNKIFSFADMFQERVTRHHVPLNEDWRNFLLQLDPLSRRTIKQYSVV